VKECARLVQLDEQLPDILAGKAQPRDEQERLEMANMCRRYKQHYHAAARLYAGAFAARPELADNPRNKARYDAARSAALAAAGRGHDATQLTEKERAALRRQALAWLAADLALWKKEVDHGDVAKTAFVADEVLPFWQGDPDLASLRAEAELAKLPAAEQEACRQFWAGVARLREQIRV